MKLYELAQTYTEIMDLDVDKDTMKTMLDALEIDVKEKAVNIAHLMNNNSGDVLVLDEEIKRLQAKKAAIKGKDDNLKEYLSYMLQNMDIKKLETPLYKFSFRKSESVKVIEKDVPVQYKKVKTTKSIDKVAIKKALKSGEVIEGCTLEVKQNLQVK